MRRPTKPAVRVEPAAETVSLDRLASARERGVTTTRPRPSAPTSAGPAAPHHVSVGYLQGRYPGPTPLGFSQISLVEMLSADLAPAGGADPCACDLRTCLALDRSRSLLPRRTETAAAPLIGPGSTFGISSGDIWWDRRRQGGIRQAGEARRAAESQASEARQAPSPIRRSQTGPNPLETRAGRQPRGGGLLGEGRCRSPPDLSRRRTWSGHPRVAPPRRRASVPAGSCIGRWGVCAKASRRPLAGNSGFRRRP